MRLGILFGVLAGAVWGGVFLVPALLPQFPPVLLSLGRYLLYGAVSLVLVAPWLGRLLRRLTCADLLLLLELALTGNLIYYVLLAGAVQMTGVAAASLIIGTIPVLIAVLGRSDAGAVSLRRMALPLALVSGGMVCVNLDLLFSSHAAQRPLQDRLIGVLCAFAAVVCWSSYAVRNARFLRGQTRFDSNQWSLLWGVVTGLVGGLVWLVLLFLPGPLVHPEGLVDADWTRFWQINLLLALACSWFGNAMWNAASRRLPLTLGGQMLVFETVFAMLYGFLWVRRWPSLLELLALALLIAGVVVSARRHVVVTPH